MLGTLPAFSLSVFEPLLQGFGAFSRTVSPQNAFRSQVFIQIRPMDIRTIAKNFAVLALLRRTVPKTGIPHQGHADRSSVNDLQRQGIIADLYTLSAHFSHLFNTPRCGNTDTSRRCGSLRSANLRPRRAARPGTPLPSGRSPYRRAPLPARGNPMPRQRPRKPIWA